MATSLPKRHAPQPESAVIQWLLDSDPALRWQVMRDLLNAPAETVAAERAQVGGDGRLPLDTRYPGAMPVELDEGEGRPSRWITLRALRMLNWYAARG